jgi:sporulation protein YlmC with PRC-barrel domain
MLLEANQLLRYKIQATDGEIGGVQDVLFDDATWMVRYLVIDTGGWLSGRRVLLSPVSVGEVRPEDGVLTVKLSRQRVEKSPPIDAHKSVSRQHETDLSRYYGWPVYWSGETRTVPLGAIGMPGEIVPVAPPEIEKQRDQQQSDPHLRSAREVSGYHIQAQDGEIGHVEDFIVDTGTWWIQSMVVDTRNWLPGKHVSVSPRQIEVVKWDERKVFVGMFRNEIESGPEAETELETHRIMHE